MKPKRRLKLCMNCDGQVDLDVIVCPYCGSDLLEDTTSEEAMSRSAYDSPHKTLSLQETLSSLYPPPYQPRQTTYDAHDEMEEEYEDERVEEPIEEEEKRGVFGPTLLFSLGMNLFLLGLFLFFFSEKGAVTLKWDAHYWFIYFLSSIPLVYFGYKKLSKAG